MVGTTFQKEADILDVWFESGCSYLVETASEPNQPWPSDLYLEGGDQYPRMVHVFPAVFVGRARQCAIQNGRHARMDAG